MGHAARKLTYGFHFLGLQVFALERLAFGYALAGSEEGFDLARRIALGFNGALEEFNVAGLEPDGDFKVSYVLAKLGKLDAFGKFFLVACLDHIHEGCKVGMDDGLLHADEARHFG